MRLSQHSIRAVLRYAVAEHEGVQQRTPTDPEVLRPMVLNVRYLVSEGSSRRPRETGGFFIGQ